jgi:hypothetical protein
MSKNTPENPMYGGNRTFDSDRLKLMAENGMDTLSEHNLGILEVGPEDHVLDVGAGSHPGVGNIVESMGATYTAVEKNPPFAEAQARQGHDVIQGSVTDMLLHDNSMSVVHLRFANSWFGSDRPKAWGEIIRVGTENLRGVSMDYDWNDVDGPPEVMALFNVLKPAIKTIGYDPDCAAKSEVDIGSQLTEIVGPRNFRLESNRSPLQPDTPEKLQEFITKTIDNVILALLVPTKDETPAMRAIKLQYAAELRELLPIVQAANLRLKDVKLPDVVSVRFWLHAPQVISTTETQESVLSSPSREEFPLGDEEGLKTVLLARGWDASGDPDGKKSVAKFLRLYRRSGYINSEGLTPKAVIEAIDPKSLRAREDLAATINPKDVVVASARLLHPNDEGIASLPTGHKIISEYGKKIFPPGFMDERVGEIVATVGSNSLATFAALLACVYAARKAGLHHIIYGVVADEVERHLIDHMFGPAMQPLTVGEQPANVFVKGPGYTERGIELATGYGETENIFNIVIASQRNRDSRNARYIINHCQRLEALMA